ncbi:copper chaperone PCu(A)C [Methylobacillus pratensis]
MSIFLQGFIMLFISRFPCFFSFFSACLFLALSTSLHAEILGTSLRIWTTEPGQKSTSAYMILTSSRDSVLTNVTSPIAKQAAFFRTVRIGGTLRMNVIERLPLAAGSPVDFTTEGYQLVLSGLNHMIRPGEIVPVTLEFVEKNQSRQTVTLSLTGHFFNE